MKLSKAVQVIVLTTLCVMSLAYAEQRPAALGQSDLAPAEANNIKFPYIGEVTGVELNVRSGPGMNFYSCGKISSPLRVIVAEQKFTWVRILPPPGSFSWIFKQYVQTDANKPDVGVVAGENVRVYAGAEDIEPMRSDSVQITLTKGQKVRIIGQAVGDYYKIAPPEGASLWTSTQYIKFVRNADEVELKLPSQPEPSPTVKTPKPAVVIEQVKPQNRNLELYYELEKQFQDEKTRPFDEQNYSKIKAELEKLVADKEGGDVGDAQNLFKDIERCELALQAGDFVQKQKEDLNKKNIEIEKKRQERQKDIGSKYAIIGTLKASLVYESQPLVTRFIVADDNGVPVCFAEPTETAASLDFKPYLDKKIGLIGKISADDKSSLVLIKFEKIELFEKEQPTEQPVQAEPNQPQPNAEQKEQAD